MRRNPTGPSAGRFTAAVAAYVCVLFGAASITGLAGQVKPVTEASYTAAQAERGHKLYQEQCAACHGDKLEGGVGPMLGGDGFQAAWAGRPLVELADKIQNTMPIQRPGSLTRPQTIDLVAYILQFSSFPAGQAELTNASLSTTGFPAAAAAANAPAAGTGGVQLRTAGNLAQLMRAITFPNANIIFQVQVEDPASYKVVPPEPFNYILWGQNQYYGWQAVDQAAIALIESTPLFLLPGRRCENGVPAPIDRADYKQYTQELIDLSQAILKAAQARKADVIAEFGEKLDAACANCHKVYRDSPNEGIGRGAERCK